MTQLLDPIVQRLGAFKTCAELSALARDAGLCLKTLERLRNRKRASVPSLSTYMKLVAVFEERDAAERARGGSAGGLGHPGNDTTNLSV